MLQQTLCRFGFNSQSYSNLLVKISIGAVLSKRMQNNIVSDFFSAPTIKLFCRQLKDCKRLTSTISSNYEEDISNLWLIPLESSISGKQIVYTVHNVWLQGTILSIINMTHFILKDGSHGIVKISLNSFPVTWIAQGAYCSVIGSITSSWQTPLIEAIKVTKLDNSLYLQRLWEWEVRDLANELCNKK